MMTMTRSRILITVALFLPNSPQQQTKTEEEEQEQEQEQEQRKTRLSARRIKGQRSETVCSVSRHTSRELPFPSNTSLSVDTKLSR